ncbi:hypothetical protein ALC62_14322, partial [Cyphomyrmex costatus]
RPRGRLQEERRGSAVSPSASGCWNCGQGDHLYSKCPWKRREFCFGCGRRGETLRTCPRCKDRWRDKGPYHPMKGHDLCRK